MLTFAIHGAMTLREESLNLLKGDSNDDTTLNTIN